MCCSCSTPRRCATRTPTNRTGRRPAGIRRISGRPTRSRGRVAMTTAREFWEGFLGYQSPFSIPRKNPNEQLVWIKINDRQTIELFPGSEVTPETDRLYHIAVEVDDAEAMRVYLQSKGVEVPPKTA